MFTSESPSIGAFTHTMVKGLSRGKFAAANFYSGTLPRFFAVTGTHLPWLISVFMQLFSRETLEGLLERAGFSVLKTVDMQDKNKNITQVVKVEFEFEFALQKKIYKNICLCYLMCERTISDVSLKTFLK